MNLVTRVLVTSLLIPLTANLANAQGKERETFGSYRVDDETMRIMQLIKALGGAQWAEGFPRYRIRLANIYLDDCSFDVFGGNGFSLRITLENDGEADTGEFELTTNHLIIGAGGSIANRVTRVINVPLGADVDTVMPDATGSASVTDNLPDRTHNWEVVVQVIMDSKTDKRPGGEVWESNEMDNIAFCSTTIYCVDPNNCQP